MENQRLKCPNDFMCILSFCVFINQVADLRTKSLFTVIMYFFLHLTTLVFLTLKLLYYQCENHHVTSCTRYFKSVLRYF